MLINISNKDLSEYVGKQIGHYFPDKISYDRIKFNSMLDKTMDRVEYCFRHINSKYFRIDNRSTFDYLHGDHYSMFLYLLSNTIYREGFDQVLSAKLFLLNKALFGIDIFYEISLPDIFLFVHPIGSIIGRGKFNDYLIIYQGCNIGNNHSVYPNLGKYVTLHPNVSILGNCTIGNNCEFGSNSLIIDKDLDDNTIYIGTPRQYTTKTNSRINKIWD